MWKTKSQFKQDLQLFDAQLDKYVVYFAGMKYPIAVRDKKVTRVQIKAAQRFGLICVVSNVLDCVISAGQ